MLMLSSYSTIAPQMMLSRLYSVVLIALIFTITAHLTAAADPWSYLSVDIPVALSDMSITILTTTNNSTNTEGDDEVKKIILTGGCVSPKGNEWLGEVYGCLELTNKVRRIDIVDTYHLLCYRLSLIVDSLSLSPYSFRYSHSNQSHPKHNSKHGPVPSPPSQTCHVNVSVTAVFKLAIISVLLVDVMYLIRLFLKLIVMIPLLMFGQRWELCRWNIKRVTLHGGWRELQCI